MLARFENWFTRALCAPGMALQALTTRTPDADMCAVAIRAFAACLSEAERARVLPAEEETAPAQEDTPQPDADPAAPAESAAPCAGATEA